MNAEPITRPDATAAASDPFSIAALFTAPENILDIAPHGDGLINDSFLVRQRTGEAFLLQRLNPAVFPEPAGLMHNIRLLGKHWHGGEDAGPTDANPRRAIRLLLTHEQKDCHYDQAKVCWRAWHFIENSRGLKELTTETQAKAVGAALGEFHARTGDLAPALLHDTMPEFHVTPCVLRTFDQIINSTPAPDGPDVAYCRDFIHQRRAEAAVLEQGRARGILRERVIHGDPKVDNILFDRDCDRALALVDLDTVKPGLLQYDVGDCLRSCCNRAGDNPDQPGQAEFDPDLARALLTGYLAKMRGLLTRHDLACFYEAVHLITFELGVRFFSDYLAGNRYFKVDDPEHSLRRALTQFGLVASIEKREKQIRLIVNELQSFTRAGNLLI